MKRLATLVLVAVVILVAVVPVVAAGPGAGGKQQLQERRMHPQPGRQYFALVGTITDLEADTITVQVQNGNRLVKPYIGQALTIQVTGNTQYRQWTPTGCLPIEPTAVTVGDTTSIQGLVSESSFIAQRITIDVPLKSLVP